MYALQGQYCIYQCILFLALHKKLEKLAKDKLDCELVSEWMKSLVNQYKWSAASMPDAKMLTRSGKSGHQ